MSTPYAGLSMLVSIGYIFMCYSLADKGLTPLSALRIRFRGVLCTQ